MSSWTYVSGLIEVDTFAQTSAEAIFKAQTVVNHLPRITGSEGAAHFVVVPMPGWPNQSSGCDDCLVRVSSFDRQYIFDSPDWICQMPNSGWKDRLVDWSSVPKSDADKWCD